MKLIENDNAKTLWQRWQQNADKYPDKAAIIHWVGGEEPYVWTFSALVETADKFSVALKQNGIKRGEVCAIIIRHHPLFYPIYLGISGAGALPAVLAYPNPRLHPEKFRQGLEGMSHRSGLDRILTQRELEDMIRPFIEKPESTVDDLLFPLEWKIDNPPADIQRDINLIRNKVKEEDPVLLQHSSGTTGLQKPVTLSHRAVLDHVKYLGKALQLNEDDVVVSWLPLYHDMGLIGAFHIPLASGVTSIQIDPFEWVLAPILLFEAAHNKKATLTWLPNFAYNMLADKVHEDEMEGMDLSNFRMIINCSEPVRHDSHEKFSKRFQKYGIRRDALSASYAMAETTLAVSQSLPNKPPLEITVNRTKLANGTVDLANDKTELKRVCVSSGGLIEKTEVKIVDENRKALTNGKVGEIAVKSISMFDGYRNYPEKTAEVMDEEHWFYTGDYGFMYNNELFVIGRKKDIIIVAGKNIYPEDVEDAINQIEELIPGRVIAFGEEDEGLGTEQVAVVAETKLTDPEELHRLKMKIIKTGMGIDVNIHSVYLVPPRWLIKSSSGKPSRKANRERLSVKNDPQVWSGL